MQWYSRVPGLGYFGSYDVYWRGIYADSNAPGIVRQGYIPPIGAAPWDRQAFAALVRRRESMRFEMGLADQDWREFMRLIKGCPHRQFVIVVSPLHRSFFAHASGSQRFQGQLAEIGSLANVRVLDFMRAPYPDEFFLDTAHLNARGAQVFSRQLKERLIAMSIIADDAEPVGAARPPG